MGKAMVLHERPGVRVVTHGDSESWTDFIIYSRDFLIAKIRELRAAGWSYSRIGLTNPLLSDDEPHSGGPGQPYARRAFWYCRNRRYYVRCQHGGMDI